MERLAGGKTREGIMRFLTGISFPIHKDHLVHTARRNGAPNDVVVALEQLPANEVANEKHLLDVYPHLE